MPIDQEARDLLESHVTIILGSASLAGQPNMAPIALYWLRDASSLLIGDVCLKTTIEQIQENPQVQICFWDTHSNTTWKYNGQATYLSSGADFDSAKEHFAASVDVSDLKGVVAVTID